MSTIDCETLRQVALALTDGETTPLNAEQVQAHLAACPECRRAVEELRSVIRVLDAQSRREQAIDVWPRIQSRLMVQAAQAESFHLAGRFALLVAALLLGRGIVLVSAEPLEWIVRVVGLLLVSGWFFLLRENPFTIHSHLVETKESNP
jgi:anti-sigma factor RsiW